MLLFKTSNIVPVSIPDALLIFLPIFVIQHFVPVIQIDIPALNIQFFNRGCDFKGIAGCNDKGEEKAHVGEPQVTVHIVKTAPLEVKTELPGRTNAYRIAEVRPQVSGIVLNRNFTEGSDVQAGQSLYQIDPATYQASYDSAKGELAKSEAAAAIVSHNSSYKLTASNIIIPGTYDKISVPACLLRVSHYKNRCWLRDCYRC